MTHRMTDKSKAGFIDKHQRPRFAEKKRSSSSLSRAYDYNDVADDDDCDNRCILKDNKRISTIIRDKVCGVFFF